MVKVLIGAGMGPGLAAVVLDKLRGTGGRWGSRRWWLCFISMALAVSAVDLGMLANGDTPTAEAFAGGSAYPLSFTQVLLAVLSSCVTAFIFACAATSRNPVLRSILHLRRCWPWVLLGFAIPVFASLLSFMRALIVGESLPIMVGELSFIEWGGYVFRSVLFTLLAVGIGEETGWRGFMLPALQKRYSPLVSSLLVGLAWAPWHFPMFLVGANDADPLTGLLTYTVMMPFMSTAFTWLFNRSGGYLIPVMALHAMVNNGDKLFAESPYAAYLYPVLFLVAVISSRMWEKTRPARQRNKRATPAV